MSQLKTGVNGRITFTKVNQRLPSIKIFKDRVDIENNLNEWQRNFIEKQIEFVNKLIAESQGFLEFANHRRVQLHLILLSFDYFSSNRNEQSYNNIKSMVLKDYELLVNSSKRCSSMFSYFRDNSPQLKYKFN